MEMDKNSQLREVRMTIILVTKPILHNNSEDNMVSKAILEVIDLVREWKESFMISSVLNKKGRLLIKKQLISQNEFIAPELFDGTSSTHRYSLM